MRHIVLMADYFAFPLWDRIPDIAADRIDPAALPLSTDLRRALTRWAKYPAVITS